MSSRARPNKRRRLAPKQRSQRPTTTTILDLNDKSWEALLKHVPVLDLIRTERTCKKWQRVVLANLSSRNIIIGDNSNENRNDPNFVKFKDVSGPDNPPFSSLELWSNKLGHTVTSFTKTWGNTKNCVSINKMFPNLKELELDNVYLHREFPTSSEEYFPNLRRLVVAACTGYMDNQISTLITSSNLENIKITHSEHMGSACLEDIRTTHLKSLEIRDCKEFGLYTFPKLTDRLGGLTKLVLTRIVSLDGHTLHKLLEKMSYLEYLAIRIHKTTSWWSDSSDDDDDESDDDMKDHDNDISVSNEFYGAVCRLVRLKHLSSNIVAWDQHVEQVARCCRQLDTLKLFCKEVTGRGLQAIWSNLGKNIKFLELLRSNLKNDDVAACIENCPKLMWLRVGGDLNEVMRQAVAARSKCCPGVPVDEDRLVLICEGCHDINFGSDLDDEGNQELLDVIDIRSDSDSANDSEGQLEYI